MPSIITTSLLWLCLLLVVVSANDAGDGDSPCSIQSSDLWRLVRNRCSLSPLNMATVVILCSFFPTALIYGLARRPSIRYDIDHDAKEWPSRHCGTIFGFGARFIREKIGLRKSGC